MSGRIVADPARLRAYREEAGGMVEALEYRTSELALALDRFRASDGWWAFLAQVPPLDIDLGAATGRLRLVGEWVERVAGVFESIDRMAAPGPLDGWLRRALLASIPTLGEGGEPELVFDGRRWILSGSSDSDHIRLDPRSDGGFTVTIRTFGARGDLAATTELALSAEQAADLAIRAGEGHNVIEIPPDADIAVTITAGGGDDLVGWDSGADAGFRVGGGGDQRIFFSGGDNVVYGGAGDNELYGGSGNDYLEGGGGDNRVFAGGGDTNVLYGGTGNDLLVGSAGGNDFLVGGDGNDVLHGLGGTNTLTATGGDNIVWGGAGDDTIILGAGDNVAHGGDGRNTLSGIVTTTASSNIHRRVRVEVDGAAGSRALELRRPDWMSDDEWAAWRQRVSTDLDLVRHTRAGLAGLQALDEAADDAGATVVLAPYGTMDDPDDAFSTERWLERGNVLGGNFAAPPNSSSAPGDGSALVNYGPAHIDALDARPPIVSLYHELSHSWDQLMGGTEPGTYTERLVDADGNPVTDVLGQAVERTAPLAEINSVGHDLTGDGGIDSRPSAGGHEHPEALTENSLRRELGWGERASYTIDPHRLELDPSIDVSQLRIELDVPAVPDDESWWGRLWPF